MKKIIKNICHPVFITILVLGSFSSCKKFLEEPPSKTTALVVSTTDQLNALLNKGVDNTATVFNIEGNRTTVYGTDDYELPKALYDRSPGSFTLAGIEFMLWDINYLPDDGREVFWSGEYKKIFYANMVLDYVNKVTGSDADKAALTADAHFIRAYSYWVLANTYCLPYTDANKNEAGLPIKLTTSFEESLVRQPLSKVYELIEADLTEALKTTVPLVQNGIARHWRASKAGVNGFAARYYLNRLNYPKAIEHANAALAEYSTLVNYNTEMRYGNPGVYTLNSGTPQQSSYTVQYPYTHNNQTDYTDQLAWKEYLYFRTLSNGDWWYVPSPSLLALYDQAHDLRYTYHVVEGYSYDRGLTKPSYDYPAYVFFFKQWLPSGPTVAEMYLTKAEALARTGDINGSMTALNTLRAKRMLPGDWVNLTAVDKVDATKKVMDERRREMPFTQRWFDIRRYNNNEDPNDDIVLTRSFYPYTVSSVTTAQPVQTYTLSKNSRRWAAPIPRTETVSSEGVIVQNAY